MGSSAAYHLARRGQRVVGIDRFSPPHSLGSSHGRSRIIREAYFENPLYVALVQRAYTLWSELEQAAGGKTFFKRTGGLMIGPENGTLVAGTLRSATTHRLPHEVLSAGKLHRQYPAFSPLDDMVGILDPSAGVLFPEPIIEAQLALAEHHGAELRRETPVLGWERTAQGLEIRAGGESIVARQLIVAAGAWAAPLLAELSLPLTVERQVLHWFDPVMSPEFFAPKRMPVSMWELHNGSQFYTQPDLGDGVKIGMHHGGALVEPDTVNRRISETEDAFIYDLLRRFVPFAKGHPRERAVCVYTNTPDHDFIVDRHPGDADILILSPCSGHGFKFASVLGEVAADLLMKGESSFDLSPFRVARFGAR
jgi:sarcosine oxidase